MGCLMYSLIAAGMFSILAGLLGIILGAIGVEGSMSTGIGMVIAGFVMLLLAVGILKAAS